MALRFPRVNSLFAPPGKVRPTTLPASAVSNSSILTYVLDEASELRLATSLEPLVKELELLLARISQEIAIMRGG